MRVPCKHSAHWGCFNKHLMFEHPVLLCCCFNSLACVCSRPSCAGAVTRHGSCRQAPVDRRARAVGNVVPGPLLTTQVSGVCACVHTSTKRHDSDIRGVSAQLQHCAQPDRGSRELWTFEVPFLTKSTTNEASEILTLGITFTCMCGSKCFPQFPTVWLQGTWRAVQRKGPNTRPHC